MIDFCSCVVPTALKSCITASFLFALMSWSLYRCWCHKSCNSTEQFVVTFILQREREDYIQVGEQVFERVELASLQEKLYHFYSWSKQPNVTTDEAKQSIIVMLFFQTSVDNAITRQQKFNFHSRHDNEQPILVKSVIRWDAIQWTIQFHCSLLGFGLIFMLVTVNGYTPAWRARWAALTALMSSRLARARLCDPRRRLANL